MTEKRFTLFDDGETIIDNGSVTDDGGKKIYWTVEYVQLVQLVYLLNELNDENKTLKSDLKQIQDSLWTTEHIKNLEEENKELKETLLSVLHQLYSSESSLIYEYSTDISNDKKELAEHFKEKYSKYGWKE